MESYAYPLDVRAGHLILAASSGSAQAQVLGTFYWQLQPLGSVLNLPVTQKGSIFVIEGFEAQCGGNLSLPVTGLAIPQANGTFFFGLTSINETRSGLHTRGYVNPGTFNGTWADNTGYYNQPFVFRPTGTPVCPGGLRTGAGTPGQRPGGG